MKLYFGFGANRDLAMIQAITGRGAIGWPAQVINFQLCVESIKHIPLQARQILRKQWDNTFVSYGIIPKQNQRVSGRLWILTDAQRERIRQWELVGTWSNDAQVMAHITILGFHFSLPAISEELLQQHVKPVNGTSYKTFIVDKTRLLQVAEKVRV